MSLYIGHAYRASRLLLRYPSAIPRLLRGASSTTLFIDKSVKEEYQRAPIEVKRTHGFEICLDPKDEYLSPVIGITGSYEPEVTSLFKRILRPGSRVIDVGANVGWFTLLSASIVGREGLVVSLEPGPNVFPFLTKSVERNHFANVVLLNRVASDVDGAQPLFLHQDGSRGDSIVRDFGRGSIRIPSSRLDTVARDHRLDVVDLVKVDTEGAEPQVILGMWQLITEGKVLHMIFEWNHEAWTSRQELLSMLFEKFHVYGVNTLSLTRLSKVRKDSIPTSTLNLYLAKK